MIAVRREADGASFEVAVQPRASRATVGGERAGALRLRLTAAPVGGAANRQCVELLAKALGVPKSAVAIASGEGAQRKRIRIRGADPSAIGRALAALSAADA